MAEILLAVGATLTVALVLGEVVERVGEPALVGEIGAGIVLGPHVAGLVDYEGTFGVLATVGAMLLFFDVGYEHLDLDELLSTGPDAVSIAAAGMLVPAVAGVALGRWFGYDSVGSAFLALALSVTSIAVTARTLVDLDYLDTRLGHRIVGAAVVDDAVGLAGFSLLLLTVEGGRPVEAATTVATVAAFFALAAIARRGAVARLSALLGRARQTRADVLAIVGIVFLAGYGAEIAGLDVTVGALVVGLLVGEDDRFSQLPVREGVTGVAYGVFVPLFFAGVGARIDLTAATALDPFVVAVVVVGVTTKFVGGALGDLLAGGSPREAVAIGVGMVPKTGVGLAVVGTALAEGLVDRRLFSAFVLLVLVSVFVTPSSLRVAVAGLERPRTE
jgi:Kef-type K+ transport system membrane component KefB